MDISSEDLKIEIHAILRNADLTTTSSKKVRTDLEQKLNCDLIKRKKEIGLIIDQYVTDNPAAGEDDASSSSEAESVEDVKPAARKRSAGATPKSASKKSKKSSSASDDDDDDDSDSGSARKAKKPTKKTSKAAGAGGAKKGNNFTRPHTLSPELASLMGEPALPRHEVVRKVWALIKERDLYDPKNKQFAICDSDLMSVIGVKRFRTFGMLKYLKKHFVD